MTNSYEDAIIKTVLINWFYCIYFIFIACVIGWVISNYLKRKEKSPEINDQVKKTEISIRESGGMAFTITKARIAAVCISMIAIGFAFGVLASHPGINQAEKGLLRILEAESAANVEKMSGERSINLHKVTTAIKDNPEAVSSLKVLIAESHDLQQAKLMGLSELVDGLKIARYPYFNFVPFKTSKDIGNEIKSQLAAELMLGEINAAKSDKDGQK